jgi:hypothetical protein
VLQFFRLAKVEYARMGGRRHGDIGQLGGAH